MEGARRGWREARSCGRAARARTPVEARKVRVLLQVGKARFAAEARGLVDGAQRGDEALHLRGLVVRVPGVGGRRARGGEHRWQEGGRGYQSALWIELSGMCG